MCFRMAGICGVHPKGLTLRQLWAMGQARLGAMRHQAIAMAWLTNANPSGPQVAEYLRCGEFDDTSRNDVEPYDQATVRAMVGVGNGGSR